MQASDDPRLRSLLDAKNHWLDKARGAAGLLAYASHIPGCAYDHGRGVCDCGLRDLEREFGPLLRSEESDAA